MEPDPMALEEQLEAVVPEGWLDADLDMEVLQLMDPPQAIHSRHGYTALHTAVEDGHLGEVQQVLASGADVNARTPDSSTPLHLAARWDHSAVAAALLLAGAACDAQDSWGRTPLHVAAMWGSKDTMKQLWEGLASLHAFDADGNQPLHLACSHGRAEATRLLLARGAPVNQQRNSRDGYTPLHAACDRSRQAAAQSLLEAGADSTILDHKDEAPLHMACKRNCTLVVQRLLQLPEVLAGINAPTRSGATPLWLAAARGHSEVVSMLVDVGANVHLPGRSGQTPLHAAIANKHTGVVQQLLAAGANINHKYANGKTLLHTAIGCDQLADVQQLLALGADPGELTASGFNCLHYAVGAGCPSALEALLQAVARGQGTAGIDDVARGMTALHWAVERKQWDCVEMLVAAGADASKLYGPEAVTTDGGTQLSGASALHRAVQLGAKAVVPLLATPATLHHLWKGKTPLHMAMGLTQHTKTRVCRISRALLAAGAPPGLPDQGGVTALYLAASSSNKKLQKLVPSMVRTECVLYQQQQQQQQGIPVAELAAVLAAVAGAADDLLPLEGGDLQLCLDSIRAVKEVLGTTAASSLLRQLLLENFATGATCRVAVQGVQLVKGLHRSWMAVRRSRRKSKGVTITLQALVVQPLQQRLQQLEGSEMEEGSIPSAWPLPAAAAGGRAPAEEVKRQGVAAAQSGQWEAVVQSMEQLAAMGAARKDRDHLLAMAAQCTGSWSGVTGLCEALLAAWGQLEGRAKVYREPVDSVTAAVQAWQQLQQGAAGVGGSSRHQLG